ncbi:FMN-dependent NADH-azoreductase [Marinomonas spartinae]|uniref:NAD(P)H-dependent oxidoreductase n=1 Tax=Marinomonas spartinae TaxID=1792290 RepID=UPI000808DC1B|nr:NAD(P)H-dependent oxidoreductase [Marinomonas spartinae]SBS38954.1 FMN-dependent NADH-azoreductase [Marinomonas spartinae]
MKKVLVVNANPKSNSLCKNLAERYAHSASVRHQVKRIDIGEMNFEISLEQGYDKTVLLEPDLLRFQELVKWSEHIVIVSPVWWGTVPAKFKGMIDRSFLPNFAFKYIEGKAVPEKLLKGRTSELIVTLDTPPFWYKYAQGNVIYKHLKSAILEFSGIKNRASTYFGPVMHSTSVKRAAWLNKVSRLAEKI